MSLKKVKQVRGDRGFRIWDLAVYAALAVIIIALFIAFVFTADSSPITSVSIVSGFGSEQHTICTYNFQTDALNILDNSAISVSHSKSDGIELTFRGSGDEYNVIYIDKANHSVSVTSANCPAQDCVHSPHITANSSLPIVCATHELVIRSDVSDDDTIIIG